MSEYYETFTAYDAKTGEIFGVMTVPKDVVSLAAPGYAQYPGVVSGAGYYIDPENKQPVERQPSPIVASKINMAADGIDMVQFANLPTGTTATTPSGVYLIDDGGLQFVTTVPGRLFFRFDCFPFLSQEFTVTAV